MQSVHHLWLKALLHCITMYQSIKTETLIHVTLKRNWITSVNWCKSWQQCVAQYLVLPGAWQADTLPTWWLQSVRPTHKPTTTIQAITIIHIKTAISNLKTIITDSINATGNAIPSVHQSVCFHSIFRIDWLLTLNFCKWVGHDHSSQGIEGIGQGHGSG